MKKQITIAALPFAALALGCNDAPSDPSWDEDVVPIVKANCLRCHSYPAIGGAPTDFRLDSYQDTVMADGRVVRGAATMAAFVAVRAGVLGTMPPDFDRASFQRETFEKWWEERSDNGGSPKLGDGDGNRSPRATLLTQPPANADDEPFLIEIEVKDVDDDLVVGSLWVDDTMVYDSLQSGRQVVQISPAVLSEGSHELRTQLSDSLVSVERELASFDVTHASGNTAPSFNVTTPIRDRLFAEGDDQVELSFELSDPDLADTHTLDIYAFRGEQEELIVDDLAAVGTTVSTTWDPTTLDEGPGWRLRAELSDGEAATTIETPTFRVSHSSTNLTFSDVSEIFSASCAACHPRAGIPGLSFSLTEQDPAEAFHETVDELRGLIYRRVIVEQTMPPPSSETIAEQNLDSWTPLSESDRQTLREYLLGGSPQ